MVLTSHDQLGNTGAKTGFWLEEYATPYYAFKDANASSTLVLKDVKAADFDAVVYRGGNGPLWDLVEDMLTKNGGVYSKGADWNSHVVTDWAIDCGSKPGIF